ncbi:MAG TPA: branched-chain amino acid ABC transporter permease [Sedimenticola thiotaurini]|uniref:Branched-chain amino acid ABC transporter permease n=1 Tax=Sedimenticola thiotaurini TaxID=1543721 RepID=A0A831W6N5_9GAMM|nr:branched-chain amino acid ABC transporter permease [Sedimenticola thiotaurini]
MNSTLVISQLLNGLQLGVLLFLLAAGLTLVLGIMNFVNLAHGSFYMVGAYLCATFTLWLDSFLLGLLLAIPAMLLVGVVTELLVVRHLYRRDHLDQVLASFGLILVFDSTVHMVWGPAGLTFVLPAVLNGQVTVFPGVEFPVYRLLIIAVGLLVALGLYLLVARTRVGMLIRAGAANPVMVGALGVDIKTLFTLVFALGAVLAGIAGMLIAPITEASIGMGKDILIITLVVIIIGGIGSIRGSFIAAMVVGLIDTLGRSYLDDLLKLVLSNQAAETSAPAISSMLIYILMAVILYFRPEGLFPPRSR